MPTRLSPASSRIPASPRSRTPSALAACVVVGRDEDLLALGEAMRWRDALGARLSVLYALAAPLCAVSFGGGIWCEDPSAVRIAVDDWLAAHTAGLDIEDPVILPGPGGGSVGEWIVRNEPWLLVAARRRAGIVRLLGGDASAHLPRRVRSAVRLVSVPRTAAAKDGPPG